MPNRAEARFAKAALANATGRLPLLRLFLDSTHHFFTRQRHSILPSATV